MVRPNGEEWYTPALDGLWVRTLQVACRPVGSVTQSMVGVTLGQTISRCTRQTFRVAAHAQERVVRFVGARSADKLRPPNPNEDIGRRNSASGVSFRGTLRGCKYLIWATNHRNVPRNDTPDALFRLPISSFGLGGLNVARVRRPNRVLTPSQKASKRHARPAVSVSNLVVWGA